MAVAIVQSGIGIASGTVNVALTGVTAGNGIVIFGVVQDTARTLTASDNNGNSWTQANATTASTAGFKGYIWYDPSAAGGNTTFTITPDSGTPSMRLVVIEVSGHNTTSAFNDAANGGEFNLTSTPSGAAVTTTAAGRALCLFSQTNGFSVSSWNASWTQVGLDSRTVVGEHATSASTTYTPGLTFGSSEIGIILCINVAEASGGGGGSTPGDGAAIVMVL